MTGLGCGLTAAEIKDAFLGAAELHEDGSVTLDLSGPISVEAGMTLRGRKTLSFDKLVFHPLPKQVKAAHGDQLLDILAASLRQDTKVAKRITRAVSDQDFDRIRALLGHVLMVMDGNSDPEDRSAVLALLSPVT